MRLRSWIVKTGALAAGLACSLVFAMPGGAVTGGIAVKPAPSWAADIVVFKHHKPASFCSGALVGSSWVLTAAQCVAGTTKTSPCKFSRPYPAKAFKVYLARTSVTTTTKTPYNVTSVSRNGNGAVSADGQCVFKNDVALLHLSKSTTNTPLWIAPSQAALTQGTNVSLYGYGQPAHKTSKRLGSLRRTNDGNWTLDTQCSLAAKINETCVHKAGGKSAGTSGDTGGPWVMNVDGAPVEALAFSGYDKAKGFAYGTGVAQASTGAWLHAKVGIPVVAPGSIVHDPVSGNSWLIDPQGYRRPITDAGTHTCLTGDGDPVVDLAASAIQLMAARTASATCVAAGSGVLIAGAGDGGFTEPDDNIANLLSGAGYQVTESPTLPSDLSTFSQIWWVDIAAPTSAEQSQLIAFEGAGGSVFLTGERSVCCSLLDAADTSMINAMVVGGGITAGGAANDTSCASAIAVNPNLGPDLLSSPFTVDHWTPSLTGGLVGVPNSSVIASCSGTTAAAAWDRSSLVGHGRLVVFMDVNWTEVGFRDSNWGEVAQNVALYLSGLSTPPGTPIP